MIKIALDIMGGDNAPQSNINGAIDFLKKNQGSVKIYMVGNEKYILPELEKNKSIPNDTFEIILLKYGGINLNNYTYKGLSGEIDPQSDKILRSAHVFKIANDVIEVL